MAKVKTVTGLPSVEDVQVFVEMLNEAELLMATHPHRGLETPERKQAYGRVFDYLNAYASGTVDAYLNARTR